MERVCADCQTQVDTRRHQAPVQTKVPEETQGQMETQEEDQLGTCELWGSVTSVCTVQRQH